MGLQRPDDLRAREKEIAIDKLALILERGDLHRQLLRHKDKSGGGKGADEKLRAQKQDKSGKGKATDEQLWAEHQDLELRELHLDYNLLRLNQESFELEEKLRYLEEPAAGEPQALTDRRRQIMVIKDQLRLLESHELEIIDCQRSMLQGKHYLELCGGRPREVHLEQQERRLQVVDEDRAMCIREKHQLEERLKELQGPAPPHPTDALLPLFADLAYNDACVPDEGFFQDFEEKFHRADVLLEVQLPNGRKIEVPYEPLQRVFELKALVGKLEQWCEPTKHMIKWRDQYLGDQFTLSQCFGAPSPGRCVQLVPHQPNSLVIKLADQTYVVSSPQTVRQLRLESWSIHYLRRSGQSLFSMFFADWRTWHSLICEGEVLRDARELRSYGLSPNGGSVVFFVPPGQEIEIKPLTAPAYKIPYHSEMSVANVKQFIQKRTGWPPSTLRLIFNGRVLDDQAPLGYYSIGMNNTVDLVFRLRGGRGSCKEAFEHNIGTLLRTIWRDFRHNKLYKQASKEKAIEEAGPSAIPAYWKGPLQDHYPDRGGEPYFCPEGFVRFSLMHENFDQLYQNRAIAYHGTHVDNAIDIFLQGIMMSVGRGRTAHGKRAYLSPSIVYCSHDRYSKHVDCGEGRKAQYILECRVNPSVIVKKAQTIPWACGRGRDEKQIDRNFNNGELEWPVQTENGRTFTTRDQVVVSGIMMRVFETSAPPILEGNLW